MTERCVVKSSHIGPWASTDTKAPVCIGYLSGVVDKSLFAHLINQTQLGITLYTDLINQTQLGITLYTDLINQTQLGITFYTDLINQTQLGIMRNLQMSVSHSQTVNTSNLRLKHSESRNLLVVGFAPVRQTVPVGNRHQGIGQPTYST